MEIQEYYDIDIKEDIESKGPFYNILKRCSDYKQNKDDSIISQDPILHCISFRSSFAVKESFEIKEPFIEEKEGYLIVNAGLSDHLHYSFIDENEAIFILESKNNDKIIIDNILNTIMRYLKKILRYKLEFDEFNIIEKSTGKYMMKTNEITAFHQSYPEIIMFILHIKFDRKKIKKIESALDIKIGRTTEHIGIRNLVPGLRVQPEGVLKEIIKKINEGD
ncbi:MAG: hypothetical protein ACOCP4_02205 [Candidatus Woesearchaeota archaeon]